MKELGQRRIFYRAGALGRFFMGLPVKQVCKVTPVERLLEIIEQAKKMMEQK